MSQPKLTKAVLVLLFLFLLIAGLVVAKEFLMPLAFAGLISMLLVRQSVWLESKGFPRWLSILLLILMVLLFVSGVSYLIIWQITDLESEISQFNRTFAEVQRNLKKVVRETLGLSWRDANELVSNAAQKDKAPEIVTAVIKGATNILTISVVTLVYVFLIMYFRTHIRKFILKLVPDKNRDSAMVIIKDSITVSHGYLTGLVKMIVCLWILYSIGFTIAGIKHGVMFAVLCGSLEVIPFVGNIIGTALTIAMALIQGGGFDMVIILVVVYVVVQFIQTYLLEPFLVGSEVNLNPLFTIIALILGEILWGIPGMILAIPALGIVKIVCDNIEELKPYGFLLGQENPLKKRTGLAGRLRRKRTAE